MTKKLWRLIALVDGERIRVDEYRTKAEATRAGVLIRQRGIECWPEKLHEPRTMDGYIWRSILQS